MRKRLDYDFPCSRRLAWNRPLNVACTAEYDYGLCKMTSLSFRTYEAESPVHKHPFVQVVLPVQGELEIELEGRGGRLDLVRGASLRRTGHTLKLPEGSIVF
jgi:hypothetical protein